MEKKVIASISLSRQAYEKLCEFAAKNYKTRSAVLQEFIDNFFELNH
jgi:metal-responsive CopG/Arc/MetJ family transcriptional regulator